MATLTAARPAVVRPAARTAERPAATPAQAPARRPAPRPFRIAEPAGIAEMRAAVAASRAEQVRAEQVHQILGMVRAGRGLTEVAATVALTDTQVLDVVAGVGSRISQANKTGPKADVIDYAAAPRKRIAKPGPDAVVVVIPAGFEPSADHQRDVTRALAAILLADPSGDDRPVSRWLASQSTHLPVHYTHLTHLHFLAERGTHTLDPELFDVDVQDVWVRSFDLISAEVTAAVGAVARLCRGGLNLEGVAKAADAARWLTPLLEQLADTAAAALSGDNAAVALAPRLVARVRAIAENRPGVYLPRTLADLSREQVRLIAARHKMTAADIEDTSRTARSLDEYARTVVVARAQLEAELARQA